MFALPVSAASGDKATITFDYCYDNTGNTIKFQQTTVSDGYTVGTPGEERCKIFADGKEAYCIEPGHTLYLGNTLTKDGSTVWKNLGSAKQEAINLALRQAWFGAIFKRNRGSEMGGDSAYCMGVCFRMPFCK